MGDEDKDDGHDDSIRLPAHFCVFGWLGLGVGSGPGSLWPFLFVFVFFCLCFFLFVRFYLCLACMTLSALFSPTNFTLGCNTAVSLNLCTGLKSSGMG